MIDIVAKLFEGDKLSASIKMSELAQKIFGLDKDLLHWVLEMIDLIATDGIPKSRKVQYFNQNIHLLLSTYLEQLLKNKDDNEV